MKKMVFGAAVAVLMVATTSARAAIWIVSNGTFNDGGTFSGQFDYDFFGGGIYSNISITTTAGTVRSGDTFSDQHLFYGSSNSQLQLVSSNASDLTGENYLYLSFSPGGLTSDGGTFSGSGSFEATCNIPNCANVLQSGIRTVTGFTFMSDTQTSPIPLPAGLPLLLAGLGAFGIAGRRKLKAA